MIFRETTKKNIKNVMDIINASKEYFKKNNINQWQNGYPNEEVILNDIKNGEAFVLLDDENTIIGTVAISFRGESTYDKIYEGKWLTNSEYAVIHRIAIKDDLKGRGISREILKEAEKLCLNKNINSIKIDTHEENLSMQRFLEKSGFKYCGIIYLNSGLECGEKRIAFEKLI